MYKNLVDTTNNIIRIQNISEERQSVLQPLVDFVQQKISGSQAVNINFICIHNSRRSHLAQVWAQVAAAYFNIADVYCYSGGMEATALFLKVTATLRDQGLAVFEIAGGNNPVYAVKYDDNAPPVIGFSKKYDSAFNPQSAFAAVMTCSQADGGCPFIAGAK